MWRCASRPIGTNLMTLARDSPGLPVVLGSRSVQVRADKTPWVVSFDAAGHGTLPRVKYATRARVINAAAAYGTEIARVVAAECSAPWSSRCSSRRPSPRGHANHVRRLEDAAADDRHLDAVVERDDLHGCPSIGPAVSIGVVLPVQRLTRADGSAGLSLYRRTLPSRGAARPNTGDAGQEVHQMARSSLRHYCGWSRAEHSTARVGLRRWSRTLTGPLLAPICKGIPCLFSCPTSGASVPGSDGW